MEKEEKGGMIPQTLSYRLLASVIGERASEPEDSIGEAYWVYEQLRQVTLVLDGTIRTNGSV